MCRLEYKYTHNDLSLHVHVQYILTERHSKHKYMYLYIHAHALVQMHWSLSCYLSEVGSDNAVQYALTVSTIHHHEGLQLRKKERKKKETMMIGLFNGWNRGKLVYNLHNVKWSADKFWNACWSNQYTYMYHAHIQKSLDIQVALWNHLNV